MKLTRRKQKILRAKSYRIYLWREKMRRVQPALNSAFYDVLSQSSGLLGLCTVREVT